MRLLAQLSAAFADDLESANIVQSRLLTQRFLASLLTKRFVILTGLAGSGKTKLAQAFALWIDGALPAKRAALFNVGDQVAADRVSYNVDAVDSLAVQFSNVRDDGRAVKVTLPLSLIDEWRLAVTEQGYNRQTPARTIREKVAESTRYSTQLNSFETHLKAAAFHILDRNHVSLESDPQRPSATPAYAVVAVGADWHNSEPVLGYADALNPMRYVRTPVLDLMLRAEANSTIPHFLILDEMNLSHVERYFSDVLSAIESNEPLHLYDSLNGSQQRDGVPPSMRLPVNLFIVGTVNVDETTYLFSPKVLDRANSIEFRVQEKEIDRFIDSTAPINLARLHGRGKQFASDFLSAATGTPPVLSTQSAAIVGNELKALFRLLAGFGLEFGFRTAFEMDRFIRQYALLIPDWSVYDAIDAQVYQKTLPRLNGSRASLEPVLAALSDFCQRQRPSSQQVLYPLAGHKIERMRQLLRQNGFTSFAEA